METTPPGGPGRLDEDVAAAAGLIQALREAGQLRDAQRLVLHLKPEGKRIGRIEVSSIRMYEAPRRCQQADPEGLMGARRPRSPGC